MKGGAGQWLRGKKYLTRGRRPENSPGKKNAFEGGEKTPMKKKLKTHKNAAFRKARPGKLARRKKGTKTYPQNPSKQTKNGKVGEEKKKKDWGELKGKSEFRREKRCVGVKVVLEKKEEMHWVGGSKSIIEGERGEREKLTNLQRVNESPGVGSPKNEKTEWRSPFT